MFQLSKGEKMRGGKREGAGRKRKEETKMYRLPVRLEEQIKSLISNDRKTFQKSKERVKPTFPTLTKEQKKRLSIWLRVHNFAKSGTEVRKMTETPSKTKQTVIKYSQLAGEKYNWTITDIIELYAID